MKEYLNRVREQIKASENTTENDFYFLGYIHGLHEGGFLSASERKELITILEQMREERSRA